MRRPLHLLSAVSFAALLAIAAAWGVRLADSGPAWKVRRYEFRIVGGDLLYRDEQRRWTEWEIDRASSTFRLTIAQERSFTSFSRRLADLALVLSPERTATGPASLDVSSPDGPQRPSERRQDPWRDLRRDRVLVISRLHSSRATSVDAARFAVMWYGPEALDPKHRPHYVHSLYQITVPHYAPLLLTALLPARWLHLRLRARLARRLAEFPAGRCPRCGYDLRSDPGGAAPPLPTCPECGPYASSPPTTSTPT